MNQRLARIAAEIHAGRIIHRGDAAPPRLHIASDPARRVGKGAGGAIPTRSERAQNAWARRFAGEEPARPAAQNAGGGA
jgi:hypothetical protein